LDAAVTAADLAINNNKKVFLKFEKDFFILGCAGSAFIRNRTDWAEFKQSIAEGVKLIYGI